MKNTDIALIVVVATLSVVISYFVGNMILGNPSDRVEKISYIEPIDGDIAMPNEEIFNPKAVNPTVEVYVGNCGPMEHWDNDIKICVSDNEENPEEEDSDGADGREDGDSDGGANGSGDVYSIDVPVDVGE